MRRGGKGGCVRWVVVGLLLAWGARAAAADLGPLLARIKAVGREGAGNADARDAGRQLAAAGPEALPAILAALDDADPTAANWLRTAADSIAERTLAAGRLLPAARLEAFVKDTRHSGRGRRLAYEWLVRVDPGAPDRLLPGMLHDPGAELRRDAVARVLDEAQSLLDRGDRTAALAAFRRALSGACDQDQVERIAARLKPLGVPVDPACHLGFVRSWLLAAPFDNTGGAGFRRAFPPETKVDLAATYTGKGGARVSWVEHTTHDPYGIVALNKALGKHKGAVAYAFAAIDSPAARPVEVRVGCVTALKIFLNGKELFGREEYHHGMRMDQHVAHGMLRAGRNELRLKVCQNEQTEDWAQQWQFQARLCDEAGAAVPFTVTVPKPPAGEAGEEVRR
jgi:hypothetical protein